MKTSRIKSIQIEQFQHSITEPSVEFFAYPLAGRSLGSVLPAPVKPSLHGFGPQQHPSWIDLAEYAPARPYPERGRYETSNGFAQIMDSMTCKDADLGENGAYRNPDAFAGQRDGFAHAHFPVVYRISPSHLKTTGMITNDFERITVVPFRVVASTWPWMDNGSNMDYTPIYQLQQFHRDGVRIDLHIDYRFIDEDNEDAHLAILAGVLSVLPSRWSQAITSDNVLPVYLTIAPAIGMESFEDHIDACQRIMRSNSPKGERCFKFHGASLGLAVLAAVMGMPPIMYTGFNSQIGPNEILTEAGREDVALGSNMVVEIDDVEYKTAAAIIMGVPIIIPLNPSWYKESAQQALQRGVARALGLGQGQSTLLALAAKQYGYPANMKKALALANDSTNWAKNMNEFIFTTAKRAAGISFNELPSLILAATNLSDVQILAAHAVAYMWNPTGSVLVKRTNTGVIAGRDESQNFARVKQKVQRAEKLADLVGVERTNKLNRVSRSVNVMDQAREDTKSDMWDADDLDDDDDYDDGFTKKAGPIPRPAAKKAGGKKAVGSSSGAVRVRGKAAGAKKKKAPRKKAAKKPKKKASAKKKGGKKKTGGKKKGTKKKKPVGRASGTLLATSTAAKKKKKKKGKKKRPLGKASSSKKKAKKSKSKTAKKKKSKSKKSHKKKTKLGRAAGYRVLGSARRGGSGALTAKQIMQRALAKARAGKK
jgi:hypothetical protein